MINERTAGYLAEEVRKAQAEVETLDAQAREIDARREAAQIKLSVLRQALGPRGGRDVSIAVPGAQITLPTPTAELPRTEPQPAVGFASGICMVLNNFPGKGFRPMEVFERLKERGIVYQGKTKPAVRTAVELRRLARTGRIKKRGSLFYAIPVQPDSTVGASQS